MAASRARGTASRAAPSTAAVCAMPPTASEPDSDAAMSVLTAIPVATPAPPSTWVTVNVRRTRRWTWGMSAWAADGGVGVVAVTARSSHAPPAREAHAHARYPSSRIT
nr:hypothetical protein GCM10020241_20180 [Streptoalloteichus tenebrarius]